jgi:hypothetical protein
MMRVLLISMLMVLVSCGKGSRSEGRSDRYVETSVGTPYLLQYADVQCEQNFQNNYVYDISFPSIAGRNIQFRFNPNVMSLNSFYREIVFSGRIERLMGFWSGDNGGFYFLRDESIIEAHKKLVLCPNTKYDLNTYESATLHATYALKLAHANVSKMMSHIPPVTLKIAPLVHEIREKRVGSKIYKQNKVLINNAYYSPSKKEIVYLPQGENEFGYVPFNRVPFWHVPTVASHEYGHHIFATIMKNYYNSSMKHHPELCFDNHEHDHDHVIGDNEKNTGTRRVTIHTVMRSINEGFADLIGSYALAGKYTNLNLIPCLNDSREIDSGLFANGDIKVLNKKVMKSFMHGKWLPSGSCLDSVDYQDSHIIGALVAHTIDSMYKAAGMTMSQRLKAAIQWIESLNKNYGQLERLPLGEALLKAVALGATVPKQLANDPKRVCDTLRVKAPVVHSYFPCTL